MGQERPWRIGVWINGELEPYEAEMDWNEKVVRLKASRHRFDARLRYPALFADPNHAYTLVRVWLEPLKEGGFRFHHRRQEEGTREIAA